MYLNCNLLSRECSWILKLRFLQPQKCLYMARIVFDDLSEQSNALLNYFLPEKRGTQHFPIIILRLAKRSSTGSPRLLRVYLIKGIRSDMYYTAARSPDYAAAPLFACTWKDPHVSIPRDFLLVQISHRDRRPRLLPLRIPQERNISRQNEVARDFSRGRRLKITRHDSRHKRGTLKIIP